MNKDMVKYWLPTALFALAMGGSAVMDLMLPAELVEGMKHLGFPPWFPYLLGGWKLAGTVVLVAPGLPRLKEWATAGFTISLTSASIAHIAAGDPISNAVVPLVLLGIGLTSWALRPTSRKLAS